MPIPVPTEPTDIPVFPTITPAQVDAALTSAWHELFEDITAPATVINLAEIGEREAFTEVRRMCCMSIFKLIYTGARA
jgi:hypothetical protein